MPSPETGDQPDPAAELLGRWQAHHAESAESGAADDAGLPPPARPKHAAEWPPTAMPDPGTSAPDPTPGQRSASTEAGRDVIEALGLSRPAPPEPAPPEPMPPEPAPPVPRSAAPAPTSGSTNVTFPPRLWTRRLLGLLLLVAFLATVAAAYLAYDDPETVTVGLAATLLVVTLVVYAVRVGSTPTHLAIESGQLVVVRGHQREVFDLSSRYTRVEVIGTPGRPGWKVLLGRFGKDPLVIDSSVVDPRRFSEALARHRSE